MHISLSQSLSKRFWQGSIGKCCTYREYLYCVQSTFSFFPPPKPGKGSIPWDSSFFLFFFFFGNMWPFPGLWLKKERDKIKWCSGFAWKVYIYKKKIRHTTFLPPSHPFRIRATHRPKFCRVLQLQYKCKYVLVSRNSSIYIPRASTCTSS